MSLDPIYSITYTNATPYLIALVAFIVLVNFPLIFKVNAAKKSEMSVATFKKFYAATILSFIVTLAISAFIIVNGLNLYSNVTEQQRDSTQKINEYLQSEYDVSLVSDNVFESDINFIKENHEYEKLKEVISVKDHENNLLNVRLEPNENKTSIKIIEITESELTRKDK